MDHLVGRLAVITGASCGIGLAIAKALKKHGLIVCGLARNKAMMETNMDGTEGPGKFYACECDVSDQQQILRTFEWIKENFGTVQILVNNAGVLINGGICETSKTEWEYAFKVNVLAVLECSKLAVAMMREADVEGHIININSVQGHRVYRFEGLECNVYSATKHALKALTETLRNELLDTKIRVTSVSPASVDTAILQKNGLNVPNRTPTLKTEDLAQAVLFVISVPQRVEITELMISPKGERR